MSTHVCLACLLYKELYPFAPLDSSPKDLLKLTLKGWDCFFLRLSIAQRRHTWFFYSYLFFILCGSQRLLRILHLLAKDYHYRDYSASIQFLEHWSRPMSRPWRMRRPVYRLQVHIQTLWTPLPVPVFVLRTLRHDGATSAPLIMRLMPDVNSGNSHTRKHFLRRAQIRCSQVASLVLYDRAEHN